ncbi:hypothetical protein BRD01_07900 [Halobacteriales archaeon QS_8_65_32]|nr:MAG: hypothetical protein BRD01_07900 [Halobacteriales archaeon QS_8_65_32]
MLGRISGPIPDDGASPAADRAGGRGPRIARVRGSESNRRPYSEALADDRDARTEVVCRAESAGTVD